MKKYKTINFLEKNKKSNKKTKLFNIAIMITLVYVGSKIYYSLSEIQKLENYIEKNDNNEFWDTIPVMSYEDTFKMDFSKIQKIYNKLGKENIISLKVNDSNIEVEGKCINLDIINSVKEYEYIKGMSVNRIKKEGGAYIFNVSYRIGE